MIKVTYFEQPENHTFQEIIDSSKNKKHYIVKTCYGDFDNIVELAIVDVQVALKYTHFCPTSIYGAKWSVTLQKSCKDMIGFKKWEGCNLVEDKDKEWQDVTVNTDYYSDSYYLDHIEDIYIQQIKTIGYVEE